MSILTIDKKISDESISNYETLKKVKEIYENINSILKYSNIRVDTETVKELKNTTDVLKDLYDVVYSTIKEDSKEHIDLYLNTKCPHCDEHLYISDLIDYSYLCKNCDENFYDFEVSSKAWYLNDKIRYDLNSEKIKKVDRSLISEYIKCWDEGRELPIDDNMIYAQVNNYFIAIDNTSGECYVEEFETEEDVLNWFNELEDENDIEIQ